MHYSIVVLALAAIASAGPARSQSRRSATLAKRADLCGPLDTPMCCQTDVLGVADLNCEGVPTDVTTTDEFTSYCSDSGAAAECCLTAVDTTTGLLCAAV